MVRVGQVVERLQRLGQRSLHDLLTDFSGASKRVDVAMGLRQPDPLEWPPIFTPAPATASTTAGTATTPPVAAAAAAAAAAATTDTATADGIATDSTTADDEAREVGGEASAVSVSSEGLAGGAEEMEEENNSEHGAGDGIFDSVTTTPSAPLPALNTGEGLGDESSVAAASEFSVFEDEVLAFDLVLARIGMRAMEDDLGKLLLLEQQEQQAAAASAEEEEEEDEEIDEEELLSRALSGASSANISSLLAQGNFGEGQRLDDELEADQQEFALRPFLRLPLGATAAGAPDGSRGRGGGRDSPSTSKRGGGNNGGASPFGAPLPRMQKYHLEETEARASKRIQPKSRPR